MTEIIRAPLYINDTRMTPSAEFVQAQPLRSLPIRNLVFAHFSPLSFFASVGTAAKPRKKTPNTKQADWNKKCKKQARTDTGKLNLMGAEVTTSPIDLTLTAQPGQGLVLGNVVTDLANLFNPPLPKKLSLDDINSKLNDLLTQLNQQLPNVGSPPQPVTLSSGQFLALTVAPINLNLLGLNLQTSSIQVNATNQTGNGDLLGNITTTLLNTVDPNPQKQTQDLTTFNNDLNAILGKVIGVLNNATLTLPANAVSSLPPALQQLTSPTLVNSSGSASTPILNLAITSPDNGTPVNVDLLGLDITTSNIQAQLVAQTGDGQILGNLLYNLANLLNPGGVASLLPILGELGL